MFQTRASVVNVIDKKNKVNFNIHAATDEADLLVLMNEACASKLTCNILSKLCYV